MSEQSTTDDSTRDDVTPGKIAVPIKGWSERQVLGMLSLSLSDLRRLPGVVDLHSLTMALRGALAHLAGYEDRVREQGAVPLNEDVWLDIEIRVQGRAAKVDDLDLDEDARKDLDEFISSRRISPDVGAIEIALFRTVPDEDESESL